MTNLENLRNALEGLLREAGEAAQNLRSELKPTLKADGSIVTEADHFVERLLRERLVQLLPGSTVWGEEEGFSEPGEAGLWVVDPIDGTSNFRFGSPLWGITVGLIQDGQAVLGAMILPDLGECYSAHAGGGATLNGHALASIPAGPIAPYELVSYSESTLLRAGPENLPGKMRYAGAFVAEAAFVFRQCYRGMISEKANLYDVGACLIIGAELGADIRYHDGAPLELDEVIRLRRIPKPFVIFPRP